MIGLVALAVTGVTLGSWAQALGVLPYLLSKAGRKELVLPAFYAYVIGAILTTKPMSVYSSEGTIEAVLLATTAFLVLDDVLRGPPLRKDELPLGVLLSVSAFNSAALAVALTGVTVGVARLRFGRIARYLYLWIIATVALLYLGRSTLQAPSSQALVIAGLALMFPVIVDFIESRR